MQVFASIRKFSQVFARFHFIYFFVSCFLFLFLFLLIYFISALCKNLQRFLNCKTRTRNGDLELCFFFFFFFFHFFFCLFFFFFIYFFFSLFFFFFQAEDGIRDDLVTGVQTCALPILARLDARRCGTQSVPARAH